MTISNRPFRPLAAVGIALAALPIVLASSHREAPFVTEMPKVDGTDFYMFTSYEPGREDFVTLVANYLPLQDAYGGPNYFTLDPEAVYDIKIDNDGDAVEDLTFRFRTNTILRDLALPVGPPGNQKTVSVPLRNVGPISATDESARNDIELYSLDVLFGSGPQQTRAQVRDADTGRTRFAKPVDYIGTKSIPGYASYAASRIYDVQLPDGSLGRMFVGQRDDPFVVNLGETFDLINTNPLGPVDGEADTIAGKNVTSFILEIPKSFLLAGNPVIGGWTTASLPRTRVLSNAPDYARPADESGDLVQVSRLGSPLVNEVVIGIKDKNRFNASRPADDAQFLDYVTHPTLPELIEALFGVSAPDLFPRLDLIQVFLTGVPGLNENGSVGEMLRLNTAVAPTALADQSNLGVLGGDLAGFPNGRRPGDDVVDMSLRVVMGVLLDNQVAPDGQLPYTDGAFVDAQQFSNAFPYLTDPTAGAQ